MQASTLVLGNLLSLTFWPCKKLEKETGQQVGPTVAQSVFSMDVWSFNTKHSLLLIYYDVVIIFDTIFVYKIFKIEKKKKKKKKSASSVHPVAVGPELRLSRSIVRRRLLSADFMKANISSITSCSLY